MYTYSQLLSMDKQDFLKLEGAEEIYRKCIEKTAGKAKVKLELSCKFRDNSNYRPYETEKAVTRLFEGYDFRIKNPFVWDLSSSGWIRSAQNPCLVCALRENGKTSSMDLGKNEDASLALAKFEYCVSQAVKAVTCKPNNRKYISHSS